MKSFQQKPRVLVVGGGTLAQALEKKFQPSGILTFRAGRNPGPWHLDLSRDPGCWKVPGDLDWVFVCAGVTSREECERDPWRSCWVNVVGGIRVARHFERRGARVVFFGTDLLPEEGEYARQKDELRRAVAEMPHCYWIRLAKVIYPSLPIFQKWCEELKAEKKPKAFHGMKLCPLSPEAVAECAWRLASGFPTSIREASWQSNREMSYLDLATQWLAWWGKNDISPEAEIGNAFMQKRIKQKKSSYQPFADVITATDAGKWWNF